MNIFRKATAGLLATTLLLGATAPAMARPGGFGGFGYREHHDHEVGAVIAGILGFGILAAIASSGNHDAPQQPSQPYPNTPQNAPMGSQIRSENEAVDACASAAEDEGGRFSSVRSIRDVRSNGNGWDVRGLLEQRASYRDQSGAAHNFSCTVRNGTIQSVQIDQRAGM